MDLRLVVESAVSVVEEVFALELFGKIIQTRLVFVQSIVASAVA